MRSGAVPAAIALLFVAAHARVDSIEPRAYVNTPVGINFLLAGYGYSDGGLSTAASSPIRRVGVCTDTRHAGKVSGFNDPLLRSTGTHTSIGSDYDLFGFVWQYRWGQGW